MYYIWAIFNSHRKLPETCPELPVISILTKPLVLGDLQDPTDWRYVSTISLATFCGDIPWNLGLKNRPKIDGRYLQLMGSWNGHGPLVLWLAILFFDGRLKITSEEMVCHTRFPPFLQAWKNMEHKNVEFGRKFFSYWTWPVVGRCGFQVQFPSCICFFLSVYLMLFA